MRISKKAWLSTMIAGAMTFGVMTANADAAYKATFYVAGMGGHFAKAVCEVDPAQEQPIKILELTKVDVGDKDSHPVHDARVDAADKNVMFYSTYKIDPATKTTHAGKVDLKTDKVIKDVQLDVPAEATQTKAMYCASAQTKDFFIPISMSHKGYIDVLNKSDLAKVQRVFLDGTLALEGIPFYKYFHGVNSPDMKELLVTINESDKDFGDMVGKCHFVVVDMDEFVKGNVKVLRKATVPGEPKKTISFRQFYSNDGKLIANSGGDRTWILDAKTLEVLDAEPMANLEENHDAMFTPDDKYVIATSRTKQITGTCEDPAKPKEGEFLMDGQLKLYDVAAKKYIGKPTSVCLACHDKEGLKAHAVLCGLDATWK